jgi:enterochelin esterase-like enzyme
MSRGAGWALHLGLAYPQIFGSVGMDSLAIFWTDVPFIKKWLDAIPSNQMPRFYLDIGNNDRPEISESTRWFEGLLDQRNIPHEWHFFVGYHEEKYWQAHVEKYLRWYTQPWAKNTPIYQSPDDWDTQPSTPKNPLYQSPDYWGSP